MNGFKFVFAFVSNLFLGMFKKRSFSNWSPSFEAMVSTLRDVVQQTSLWSARSQRMVWDRLVPTNKRLMKQLETKPATWANCNALVITPLTNALPKQSIFYIHGGSFVFGSIETHKAFCARLALHCHVEVNLVEYSQAPEYQFPYQINELLAAFRHFLTQKKRTGQRIFLAGDGAGGNLALALLLKLSEKEIEEIGGMILLSPWGDLSQLGDTLISHAKYDWLSPKLLQHWIFQYLEHSDVKDPLVSPFLAKFKRFPRTFLSVGSAEMLFSQVDHFFARNARYHLPIQYVIARN
ncbi:MAG TPA: alpha/beta hydrolase fold domain-containing protein, partial [Pseudomonadales bacterium]|nr:alpha/beta hydrolase fold domain-containing protein [Pseudomonadales bacterium]